MSDITQTFIAGIILGFVIGLATMILAIEQSERMKAYKDVIEQCEAELPRNQHCAITAEPEEMK